MLLPQCAHTVRSAGLASARNCDPFWAIAIHLPADAGGGLKDPHPRTAPRGESGAAVRKVSFPRVVGFPITSRSMHWMNRAAVVRRCCHSAFDDDETKVSYAVSRR